MPAEALPPLAIDEFEKGILSEAIEQCHEAYGVCMNTLSSRVKATQPAKKARISRPTVDSTCG